MRDEDVAEVERLRAEVQQLRDERAAERAEVADLRRALADADARETATAEVLRVIASAPTDLAPVLDSIVQSGMVLSGSVAGWLMIRQGDYLRVAAVAGSESVEGAHVGDRRPLARSQTTTRAVLEGRTIHIPDRSDPSVLAEFPDLQGRGVPFASLSVPLMREGAAIGVLDGEPRSRATVQRPGDRPD